MAERFQEVYHVLPMSQFPPQVAPFPTVHQPRLFDQDVEEIQENPHYLSDQVVTYIGNKRSLIPFIDRAVRTVKEQLDKDKIDIFEPFTGSGIVARYFKQHASRLIVNDLENYTIPLGKCYLANRVDVDFKELCEWNHRLSFLLESQDQLNGGFITELYAPRDESSIKPDERVFYTLENALRIDTARQFISTILLTFNHFFLLHFWRKHQFMPTPVESSKDFTKTEKQVLVAMEVAKEMLFPGFAHQLKSLFRSSATFLAM